MVTSDGMRPHHRSRYSLATQRLGGDVGTALEAKSCFRISTHNLVMVLCSVTYTFDGMR